METLHSSQREKIVHAGSISRTITDLDGANAPLTLPPPRTAASQRDKLPESARMARAFAHAPIFFCFPKGKRGASPLDVTYVAKDEDRTTYVFQGLELLGPSDLCVFLGLVAIASSQRTSNEMESMFRMGRTRQSMLALKPTSKDGDKFFFIGIRLDLPFLARTLGYSRANRRTRLQLLQSAHRLAAVNVEKRSPGCNDSFQLLAVEELNDEELIVVLNPISTDAVVRTNRHLRLQLSECRQLKSDAARLLHSRLSWINQNGKERGISFERLCTYIYGDSVVSPSAMSSRRRATIKALEELRTLPGWTVRQEGSLFFISRPEKSKTGVPTANSW